MKIFGFGLRNEAPIEAHLLWGSTTMMDIRKWFDVRYKPAAGSLDMRMDLFETENPGTTTCHVKPSLDAQYDSLTHSYICGGGALVIAAETGVVTSIGGPNHPKIYNFLVHVTLSVIPDPNAPEPEEVQPYSRYFWYHLHDDIVKAWLTPTELRVPWYLKNYTFSIFAEYSDGVVADVTNLAMTEGTIWSSNPVGKVDGASGKLTFMAGDEQLATITATLPAIFKSKLGVTTYAFGKAKPYLPNRFLKLVSGSAGFAFRDHVPNFLFIAEGIKAEDEDRFGDMVLSFVNSLYQQKLFKPYDQLAPFMNFWTIFESSQTRGITNKKQVFGNEPAKEVPKLSSDFAIVNQHPVITDELVGHQWSLDQLIFYFGLPVLCHLPANMTEQEVKAEWKSLLRMPNSLVDEIPPTLVANWQSIGDRLYVNESDTFVGLRYESSNNNAQHKKNPMEDIPYFAPNRMTRMQGLNDFLLTLEYDDKQIGPTNLGDFWNAVEGDGKVKGKDADLVVLMTASEWNWRERNITGYILFNTNAGNKGTQLTHAPDASISARASRWADLPLNAVPDELKVFPGMSVLVHELSHSLGLGDEYCELIGDISDGYFTTDADATQAFDIEYANVQRRKDLLNNNQLSIANLKWRWHRIDSAGVLSHNITLEGPLLKLRLRAKSEHTFKVGDTVFLRHRNPSEAILRDVPYGETGPEGYPRCTLSPELQIVEVASDGAWIKVKDKEPPSFDVAELIEDFPKESVVYRPKAAYQQSQLAGKYLELTAINVLNLMENTHKPLFEAIDGDGQPVIQSKKDQIPNLGAIELPFCKKNAKRVVGLYEGGNKYHHGVYHPTGFCIMGGPMEDSALCPVCQYILTDRIRPELHPEVDKMIDTFYPMKKPDGYVDGNYQEMS